MESRDQKLYHRTESQYRKSLKFARQPVTRTISVTVKGDSISCSINNKTVATHHRSEVVAGKLRSTDGRYGLRFGHNTDATVTDFRKIKAQ